MGKGRRIRALKADEKKMQMELMQSFEKGKQEGFYEVVFYLRDKLATLNTVPGIGIATEKKVIKHFVSEAVEGNDEFERLFR